VPRVIIAAGGTGGHFYPGLVLGQELRKRGCEVTFVCGRDDACKRILAANNFSFFEINFHGFPRKPTLKIFSFFYLFSKSLFSALAMMKSSKPDAVVGMGGYISFPVALAAYLARVPVVIHEQNVLPGAANRALSFFAAKIAVSFEESGKYFTKSKTIFTGNPVRPELFSARPSEAYAGFGLSRDKATIFIFGGSQGAVKLNRTILQTIPLLGGLKSGIQFIHVTGKCEGEAEWAKNEYEKLGIKAAVFEYLDDMAGAYAIADIIICRSGAMTISELAILRKPAILVPYPHATGNHQEYNARNLVNKGNAVMILDKDFSPSILSGGLIRYISSLKKIGHKAALPEHLPQHYLANAVLELLK
jgi:UDP-N-acetylglucosamine--N-acetylmuramyl-(pentapeptide) pyrophosphoryl-undecaprenol N-acetylglucosamine transferase